MRWSGLEAGAGKDPVTDKNKKSKRGLLDVVQDGDRVSAATFGHDRLFAGHEASIMRTVYDSGKLFNEMTFDEIRLLAD